LRRKAGGATSCPMLVGHEEQKSALLHALECGRMHHAWLIAGPRGIGKRRFADWAALKLLSGDRGTGDVDPQDTAARLVRSGAHPDHRILAPPEEGKGSTTSTIVVDQIREIADFLHTHPSIAGWRTLVVDALENMNPSASNAFLKELEEPRPKTVYLLVSHAPGRLLPTIRSRCRMLRMHPLTHAQTASVLRQAMPEAEQPAIDALVSLADGAPGAVLGFAGADPAELAAMLDRLASGSGAFALARGFQGQGAIPLLEAMAMLVPRRVAAAVRKSPGVELLALYDEADAISRDALRLAYDRVQVAMALADILARMGRIERMGRAQ